MAKPGDVTWEHDEASKLAGVEWTKGSQTKGILKIDDDLWIEFDFKGYPKIQICPKEARKHFPPVASLLPALVLWEDDNHPSWAEVLQDLKNKIEGMSSSAPAVLGRPVIDCKFLEGLLEAARGSHPNESLFLLKKDARGVLAEAVLPQGTQGGKTMAIFTANRLPYDKAVVASFHSHPSGNGTPSGPDLRLFVNYKVNIIAYFPYGDHDFKAYDNKGNHVNLLVQD